MNRGLSVQKYTDAIMEALLPRMKGEDLDKLEEFKKLNPPGDLVQGSEMIMSIRGDTMMYRSSTGGVGQITSKVFVKAMADVYFGAESVSPALKASIEAGVAGL
jgi:hypothetical protein